MLQEVTCMFDHPAELSPEMVKVVMEAISTTRWKLGYHDWIEKIQVPDDAYWRNKWQEFDELASAVSHFDPDTLYRMVRDY